MYQHILFDLDGTLTNPYEGILNSVQYALRGMGYEPPPKQELTAFIGPPLGASFRGFYGMSEADSTRAVALYREYFAPKGILENEVYPGVPAMLEDLRAAGARLYLATSKPLVFAGQILDHFGLSAYFTALHGSPMDAHGAEKQAVIAQALAQNPIDPARAVMVGDTRFDILGAAACGLPAIGVAYGFGSRQDLETAGAAAIVPTVAALHTLLRKGHGPCLK